MRTLKDGATALGAIAAGLVVILLLIFAFGGISWITAPFRGEVSARNQTVGSGSYRISNYDYFYQQCNAIKADQANLANTRARLQQARKDGDQFEVQRQETNLQAQQNGLNDEIGKYNAKAAASNTSGQFRASDLPYTLDASQEITCSA